MFESQKRLRESLNSLENIDVGYKKRKAVVKSPREALTEIMTVRLTQGQLVIGKVGLSTAAAKKGRKKPTTMRLLTSANLAHEFLCIFRKEGDKENQQPI